MNTTNKDSRQDYKNVSKIEKLKEVINGLAKRAGKSEDVLKQMRKEFEQQEKQNGCPDDELEEAVLGDMECVLRKPFLEPLPNVDESMEAAKQAQKYAEEQAYLVEEHENCTIKKYEREDAPQFHAEDIFKWRHGVYFKINDKPMRFIVNNSSDKKISTIEYRCKKESATDYKCEKQKDITHGNIAFNHVTEYHPLFEDAPRLYRFNCTDSYDHRLKYTGTFNDISALIDADGHLYEERKIKTILKEVKGLLQKTGDYQLSKLPPYPGFFWIDGKLQTNQSFCKVSKEESKEALECIESFAGFYEENKKKLGYILHWNIIAPFNFAMKQAGNSNLLGSIYLVGKANSGKTTVGLLVIFIWGTSEGETLFSAGRVDTPARFGSAISNMTHPVVFDEGSIIFDAKHKDVFDLYKSAIYNKTARSVLDTNRKNTNIPSLSSIIFTSNYSAPKEAALGRRMDTFDFSVDHPRTPEEIDTFNEKFNPEDRKGPMKALNTIGAYVAQYMMDNPEYIKRPWLEVATEIWNSMYKYAGMEVPDWISDYELPAGLKDAWKSEEDRLFIVFKELLLRNAKTDSEFYNEEDETFRPRTPRDQADEVVRTGRESWIQMHTPRKGKYEDKELVVIDAGIVEDMNKEYHLPYELKRIAEDLGGAYDNIYINGKTHKMAIWELKEFLDMFGEK
jgi:hypothetical protein